MVILTRREHRWKLNTTTVVVLSNYFIYILHLAHDYIDINFVNENITK